MSITKKISEFVDLIINVVSNILAYCVVYGIPLFFLCVGIVGASALFMMIGVVSFMWMLRK